MDCLKVVLRNSLDTTEENLEKKKRTGQEAVELKPSRHLMKSSNCV